MTLARLTDVLHPCLSDGSAVAGLVVLGWEDARAFVAAAEAVQRPVILQAGPGCRTHTPLPVLGAMFRHLAEAASVPVVAHLDHGRDLAECRQAIDCGFTSVMYDGSALPFEENIARTAEITAMAHAHAIPVEAELGYVGYDGRNDGAATDPAQVARFRAETGVDALAVSVGNVHLMRQAGAALDMDRLAAIAAAAPGLPLVLHGGSGLSAAARQAVIATAVCKVNIGTELRQAFGAALRAELAARPAEFDRIALLSATEPALQTAARTAIASLLPA